MADPSEILRRPPRHRVPFAGMDLLGAGAAPASGRRGRAGLTAAAPPPPTFPRRALPGALGQATGEATVGAAPGLVAP